MAELKYTYALDKNENCIGIGNAQKGIEMCIRDRIRELQIDKWVSETISGTKSAKERKLGTLLKKLKKGDTLICSKGARRYIKENQSRTCQAGSHGDEDVYKRQI